MEEQAKGAAEPQASVPAATSQPAIVPQGTQDNKGSAAQPTASSAPAPAQDIVGGLDLAKLPEEHRQHVREWAEKREKDQLRYLTKKSEEYQTAAQKAQYYDEYVNSDEYAQFKMWASSKTAPQSVPQNHVPDAREFASLGYSDDEAAKLADIVDRRLEAKINQRLEQKEQEWVSRFNQVAVPTQQVKARQELDALAKLHPDVYELTEAGVMKAAAAELITTGQNPSIDQVYARAKEIEAFYAEKIKQKYQADVKTKKEAVTAAPTPSGDIQQVIVNDIRLINETAARYAAQGKKVRIKYEPKKGS